ncbi:MAG: copper oxidase [Acidobacteria bacterium]|nr:MAG: copper oxidase [Acidobacteriota bacterium]
MHMAIGGTRHKARVAQPVLVESPDVPRLPWRMEGNVKEFHLVAEPVKQELVPGKVANLWGFNGSAPGPTIQVNQGDRVRIIVDNHLPEPFSMHWHGFEIPHNMDGAPGTSQDPIKPGGRFVYEFTLHQEGTYFYHSHLAMQEMIGMLGAFIMHPKQPYDPPVDRDFVILLQEYAILPSNATPNSMNMEFNWLTFNGKAGPATTPLLVRLGDRVRIRMINLGMDHHPIHLHGHTFVVTGSEGGRQPKTTWAPGNTVLVGVAQARDIEFVANNPGDWMLHCHLPHPLTRRPGMPMGVSMENGMGMLDGTPGVPLGDDYGPSLGRGLGIGSTNDQPTPNGPLSQERAKQAMATMLNQEMPGMQHGEMQGMQHGEEELPENANQVPGFPQDAFMEGPMMAMDKMVDKPENYGLRPGWSGFMQGMMTFVRVLPPDIYDKIMALKAQQSPNQQQMPGMEHQHHGS